MFTVKQHTEKAKYNEKFFQETKDEYPDWAITGLFYSALHLVEAFLSKKDHSVEDHKSRFWFIQNTKELKPLYPNYRALYDYSVNARYKMQKFNVETLNDTYKSFYLPLKKDIDRLL